MRGPALSRSGYGEHTRFALRALRANPDLYDIYLIPVGWGKTGWIFDDDEERKWIDEVINKTAVYQHSGGQYDISLQVTIPGEWEKLAPINVGATAGTETNKISPEWVRRSNLMDKIIVISDHTKSAFDKSAYEAQDTQTGATIPNYRCLTPVEVVNYPVKEVEPEQLQLELEYGFNFLVVAQWGVRKNIENTISWFMEEFQNDEVGLVLKLNTMNNCIMDRNLTINKLHELVLSKKQNKDIKCKIYLLHGDLTEGQMTSLYQNDKIKALINLAHGEGFGLPIFEAVYNGLPVISPAWGGQVDFLYAPKKDKKKPNKEPRMRPFFAMVDYVLKPIQPEAVWADVLIQDSMWCFPHKGSYKNKLRSVYKEHGRYRKQAKELKRYIEEKLSNEKQKQAFSDAVYKPGEENLEEWFSNLNIEEHS